MWFCVLIAACAAPSPPALVQAHAPAGQGSEKGPERPKAVRPLEPEFDALLKQFEAALRDWGDKRVHMVHEGSREPEPPHPARAFLPRFRALSEKGSGGATGWTLEYLPFALDDPAERARVAKEAFAHLVDGHADED